MEQDSAIHIRLKEGGAANYIEAVNKTIGGKQNDNLVLIEQGDIKMKASFYSFIDEFDMIVSHINYHKDIIIEREPDNRPDFYHFNLINQGQVKQNYQDSLKYTQAGSSNGVFIYNGLFPFTSVFAQRNDIQTVGYKFSRKALAKIMPEAVGLLDDLFGDQEPKAYHTAVNKELDRLLDELFFYDNASYGRIPLSVAKGLEILPLLMKTLQSQLDKDELNGLHIDDYNRLLKVKDYLLQHLEDKVNIEDIADMFAVSLSKLKRDFKTLYDTTIYAFYTQAKMDEAYRRLRTGDYTVTEVGYDLGYQSISKFSLMFKKVKGINPKDVVPL
ncbi:helix-turn-helix transcriptional regulator [Carboxylicivirga mesophila]|uniref:Helix-turn-helix transcriptional regulator n=1 Tax=Carboxylicivirga mesophila TaxID=1166478 RepID=A0ABS5KAB3_9BACT|nr:AraC family transcriptional regulator [Carboxylicivirga mesophila]MBS2211974.1 helix-turn-helix transcriptional regulator [Carboxylicivirga mesophila]